MVDEEPVAMSSTKRICARKASLSSLHVLMIKSAHVTGSSMSTSLRALRHRSVTELWSP